MSHESLIERLVAIKKAIIAGCDDTLWMNDSPDSMSTVCEKLDHILDELGVSENELQLHYVPEVKNENV